MIAFYTLCCNLEVSCTSKTYGSYINDLQWRLYDVFVYLACLANSYEVFSVQVKK